MNMKSHTPFYFHRCLSQKLFMKIHYYSTEERFFYRLKIRLRKGQGLLIILIGTQFLV